MPTVLDIADDIALLGELRQDLPNFTHRTETEAGSTGLIQFSKDNDNENGCGTP